MRPPPHLHPRSRLTSSLFATTLFASFFVVALPHILPCPAPRVAYADDGTPQRRRRRRKGVEESTTSGEGLIVKEGLALEESGDDVDVDRAERECPIPRPGGLVGEILGFKGTSSPDGKGSRPP